MNQPPLNPYAAPASDAAGAPGARPGADFYRMGDRLIIRKGTTLPANCIVNGSQSRGQLKTKSLVWSPPWVLAIAVLISPLIGIILYFIIRKSGMLTYFISDEAAAKRRKGITTGVISALAGFALIFAAIPFEAPVLAILGIVTLVTGVIVGSVVGRPYQIMKIDKEWIHLKLKQEFWNALPNVPQQPYYLPPGA